MKPIKLITLFWILFLPTWIQADEKKPEANVNERYDVESVEMTGKYASKVSQTVRDDAQKMVGLKYSEKLANDIAQKIRNELGGRYAVNLKVEKGTKTETVKVLFQIKKEYSFSIKGDWEQDDFHYHSQEGFDGKILFSVIPDKLGVFTFGLANSSEYLLERYTGQSYGYKFPKLGTDSVHFQLDLQTYHEKFGAATQAALAERSDVPGIYRARQNFAPTLSVDATKSFAISTGLSFQRLQMQYPAVHTETAYAGAVTVQYHPKLTPIFGYDRTFKASYDLRTATRILDSDFVYTRHSMDASYSFSNKTNTFSARFLSGLTIGTPPLFERFQIGNIYTLRGWNKLDVAPLGGTRFAAGSLEYHYYDFRIFYDVGSVWDSKQSSGVKHSLGFGYEYKYLPFISLAFPIRNHHVEPVIIINGFGSGHIVAAQTFP
jgi:hypothetical protein